ncbi:GAK system XXXCH domain-containing protein [Thermodesulfobacteriota bacterium]
MQSLKPLKLNRTELVETLEKLTRQLKAGTLGYEDRQWTVPEKIQTQIDLKEKKGRLTCKIKLRWSTLDDYEAESRQEVSHWKDRFKDIKKQMGMSFAALAKAARQDTFPNSDMMQQFIEHSEAFQRLADPDWKTAMDEYRDHIENLQRAVQDKRMQDFQHELRDLKARKTICHRELK